MNKIYLAGGISDTARKNYQKELAGEIEDLGYNVYAAATNDSINDKSNDPTPKDIYMADVKEIISSDIFVQTISGGNEDGTNFESGVVAGINETREHYNHYIGLVLRYLEEDNIEGAKSILENTMQRIIPIYAFTINERLAQPQHFKGLASGGYNHLILGGIDNWGEFVGKEIDLLEKLEEFTK